MRELLDRAVARRMPLADASTGALRLADGAGDGLPGLFLDSFAGRLLLSTSRRSIPAEVRAWLADRDAPVYWKRLDQNQKESPTHVCGPLVNEPFLIRENGLAFEISFGSGYSQGIFPDQRDNRAEVRRRMQPGQSLLNTFAYTGAFSVAAAMAGAVTTTLDLSQPYLDWAKRNFSHNGVDAAGHHFCKGDTFEWLRRFAKAGRKFDGIVLDPPTFSRDRSGRVFQVEKDFGRLAALAAAVLKPDGWLLCSTNCRNLPAGAFAKQVTAAMPCRATTRLAPMPPDFTGEPYLKSLWVETR